MMSMCFWHNSHYWSSYPSAKKQNSSAVVIRVAYLKKVNWVGFNFCKYHVEAVRIFKNLPDTERFFYKFDLNCYAAFKVWCIDSKHFEKVISELKNYPDISIEFIIGSLKQVPEIFKPLNLTFYERSVREQGKLGRVGKKKAFETTQARKETNNFSEPLAPPTPSSTPAPPAFLSGGERC